VYSIISGDFNGDNLIDLAAAKTTNNVSVLIGNGLGSFSTATNFAVDVAPESVTTADFNGDGKMDLATANYTSNNLSVLMGNGLGSFSTATNFTVGIAPTSIISADFNGDSKMDLITANANSNNVSVLLNNIPIVSATVYGATITANQNAAAYQWINCNGNLPISGETNQSFVTTSNGNYAVIVTQNNCSDTSDCYNITTVGLIENSALSDVTIYPNPSNGQYTLKGNNINSIVVYNLIGEKVFQSAINSTTSEIDLSNMPNGVYFIKIQVLQTFFTKKVVIE
jgi:hypothetical protein